MKLTPAERLKAAREKRYPTAQEAAEAHGWHPVTYRSHEAGTRNFPISAARKYAQAFGVTASHLMAIGGGNSLPANGTIHVPLVARASAGAFRIDEGIDTEGVLVPAVPRTDVPAEVQYAVLVDGPSVNKRIADGAYAICAPYDRYPGGAKHGELVHVIRERAGMHEHTVKEIQYTRQGTILMPCSTDPRFQEPIALESSDEDTVVRIHGVVIGIFQAL